MYSCDDNMSDRARSGGYRDSAAGRSRRQADAAVAGGGCDRARSDRPDVEVVAPGVEHGTASASPTCIAVDVTATMVDRQDRFRVHALEWRPGER